MNNAYDAFQQILAGYGVDVCKTDNSEISKDDSSHEKEREAAVPVQEPKKKRKPADKNKPLPLSKCTKEYKMSYLMSHSTLGSNVVGIKFGIEKDFLEITGSWKELFFLILGAIYDKHPSDFSAVCATAGLFDSTMMLDKDDHAHLDEDVDNGLVIYKLPFCDYIIEMPNHDRTNHNYPKRVFSGLGVLGYGKFDVTFKILTNGINLGDYFEDKSKYEPKKSDKTKQKKPKNLKEYEMSLDELYNKRDFLMLYTPVSVSVNGDSMEVESTLELVIWLISYMLIMCDTDADVKNIEQELISNTVEDEIGVTDDEQKYLGVMKKHSLVNSKWRVYSNGNQAKMLEYLIKVLKALNIDATSITVKTVKKIDLGL